MLCSLHGQFYFVILDELQVLTYDIVTTIDLKSLFHYNCYIATLVTMQHMLNRNTRYITIVTIETQKVSPVILVQNCIVR